MASLFRTERGIPYASVENVSRIAVESLLVVTVGVLLGRFFWLTVGSSDASSPAAGFLEGSAGMTAAEAGAPNEVLLTQIDPFARNSTSLDVADASSVQTSLDIKLSGVRFVANNTTSSSAIISFSDGAQKRFVPGDEVLPGVVLVNVAPNEVQLSRNGSLEVLSLIARDHALFEYEPTRQTPAPLSEAIAKSAPVPGITPQAVASDTIMTPEMRSGKVAGYRIEPRGTGAFEAAGLKSGDLILRVNGQAIEGLRPEQISQTVSANSDLALDVVRQGAIVRLRVSPGAYVSQ